MFAWCLHIERFDWAGTARSTSSACSPNNKQENSKERNMYTLNSRPSERLSMCSKLDETARALLVARAAQFGIDADVDGDMVHMHIVDQDLRLSLPLETGLCRLVAELAGVLTQWVIFSAGKPPERVLLQYTDVKYRKLHAAWVAARKS